MTDFALYQGTLYHARFTPKRHRFSYRVMMPLVRLDTLAIGLKNIPFWSTRRRSVARFAREDFLGDPTIPLDQCVRDRIFEETEQRHEGPIYLLANWRYFGYQNNPIAVYYCFSDSSRQQLNYIVAEVTNTPWHERHSYVLPINSDTGQLDHVFDKALHVSPFNPMGMKYRWHSGKPGETLSIRITAFEHSERTFDAVLNLHNVGWGRSVLTRALLRFPFMTVKVVFAIYWQALQLWIKRVPIYPHPTSTK